MRRFALALLLLLGAQPCLAALSASTVFEVRSTGNDANGGGFVTGASGTDYSQQNAPQYALTTVTTAAANAICLDAAAAANMVGNICQIVSGTNFIPGNYQIVSVVVGVSFTLDRNCTTAAGALGVINIGGAFATIQPALTIQVVGGMITYVKATATYVIGAGLTVGAAGSFTERFRIIGYGTTRGDGIKSAIQTSAAITAVTLGQQGWSLENFDIDCNGTGTRGVNQSGNFVTVASCKVSNCTSDGIFASAAYTTVIDSEITGCGGTGGIFANGGDFVCVRNWVHDNTTTGIAVTASPSRSVLLYNVIESNSGGSSDGIFIVWDRVIHGNVIYGNGRDGIRFNDNYLVIAAMVGNNIIVGNGGYGLNLTLGPGGSGAFATYDYNALYNNTSGARNNIAAGVHDVTLSGDPFTDAPNSDFSLNNTAGAGAACRNVGYPGTIGGLATIGYADIGVYRHQDAGGGGGACSSATWSN